MMSKVSEETRQIVNELQLNVKLLTKNNVPENNIKKMKEKYKELKKLFDNANYLYETVELNGWNETRKRIAKDIGQKLEKLEENLQELWCFEKDSNYYTYWNLLPGCECPKEDNKERYGYGRIINCNCPYHSFLCKE